MPYVYRFTVERYAGATSILFVQVREPVYRPDDAPVCPPGRSPVAFNFGQALERDAGDPHQCEAVLALISGMGGRWQRVPWLGAGGALDGINDATIERAVQMARDAGVWRESEHSRTKRYFEIDPEAPSTLVMDVPEVVD